MPARFPIAMQRNEDWSATLTIADEDGVPIDVTDWAFEFRVKSKTDNATIIQSGVVELTMPAAGEITVTLRGPGNPLGSYGDPLQTVELPYDLVATDVDDFHKALVAGYVTLSRGVS